MKKRFSIILFSALVTAGITLAQEQTTPPAATTVVSQAAPSSTTDSCCTTEKKSTCAIDKPCTKEMCCNKWSMKKSCHDVLTEEERHRFCATKASVIAENPTLRTKGHKKELCEAICNKDPSMKPIMEKLKKHCEEMHKRMKKIDSSAKS